jgi:hypothetical protein
MFLGIPPVSSVSNGLYFLTLRQLASCALSIHQKERRKSLGCSLYIRCTLPIEKYGNSFFWVCKSVHNHTIQIIHQPDAKIFQFIILAFIYSSTCFGRFPAHHQGLNDCSGSVWFYLHIVVIVVLCSWSGRV